MGRGKRLFFKRFTKLFPAGGRTALFDKTRRKPAKLLIYKTWKTWYFDIGSFPISHPLGPHGVCCAAPFYAVKKPPVSGRFLPIFFFFPACRPCCGSGPPFFPRRRTKSASAYPRRPDPPRAAEALTSPGLETTGKQPWGPPDGGRPDECPAREAGIPSAPVGARPS